MFPPEERSEDVDMATASDAAKLAPSSNVVKLAAASPAAHNLLLQERKGVAYPQCCTTCDEERRQSGEGISTEDCQKAVSPKEPASNAETPATSPERDTHMTIANVDDFFAERSEEPATQSGGNPVTLAVLANARDVSNLPVASSATHP